MPGDNDTSINEFVYGLNSTVAPTFVVDYDEQPTSTAQVRCSGCGQFRRQSQIVAHRDGIGGARDTYSNIWVTYPVDELNYCTSCSDRCLNCNRRFHHNVDDNRSSHICINCQDMVSRCRYCSNVYPTIEMVNLSQRPDGMPINRMTTQSVTVNLVCVTCSNNYWFCERHGRWEDRSDRECCMRRLIGGPNPPFKFHSFSPFGTRVKMDADSSQVYLGMELEIEANSADRFVGAKMVSDALAKYVWMKNDGSLRNGMEICNHPMTLEFFKSIDWSVYQQLLDIGFIAWNASNAGIHIHVGRNAFKTESHLWKFCEMIVMNPQQSTKFAGRVPNDYCRMAGMDKKISKHLNKKPGHAPAHYDAVNLSNTNTVEVRIFRSSLKIRRILANLEFVDAVVNYTRDIKIVDVKNGALKWREFRKWIDEDGQSGKYAELLSFVDNGKED